jgi:hypothetical protein
VLLSLQLVIGIMLWCLHKTCGCFQSIRAYRMMQMLQLCRLFQNLIHRPEVCHTQHRMLLGGIVTASVYCAGIGTHTESVQQGSCTCQPQHNDWQCPTVGCRASGQAVLQYTGSISQQLPTGVADSVRTAVLLTQHDLHTAISRTYLFVS